MKLEPRGVFCFHLDIYFRLFITKNAENSACQDDHVDAIFNFVTIGLVVVPSLGYVQIIPWPVRHYSTRTFSMINSILGHFALLSNPSQLDPRYLHYSEKHLLEASPVTTV